MLNETLAAWQRDAAMRGLFKRGTTTSREIFETEFGHFPPNGLDYKGLRGLNRPIRLRTHFQDSDSGWFSKAMVTVGAMGYVHGKPQMMGSALANALPEETIYMNPVLMGIVGKAAGALITASLVSQLMANVSLAGLMAFASDHLFLSLMVLGSSLGTMPLTEIATLPFRSFSNVVGHEHVHILQIHDKSRARTGYDMDSDRFKNHAVEAREDHSPLSHALGFTDRLLSLGASGYLLNDVEVQARIHTTMANGYHRWGRLPRTPHEFWAACIDAGLDAPASIRKEIAQCTEVGVKEFMHEGFGPAFMRAVRPFISTDTAELNAAQRSLRVADLRETHWHVTMPFMYGHLLELYGDPQGRSKMGFLSQHDHQTGRTPAPRRQQAPPERGQNAAYAMI